MNFKIVLRKLSGGRPSSRIQSAWLCVMLMAFIGCGESAESLPRAATAGLVTLDNRPLEAGTIRFVPVGEAGGPKVSASISGGTFCLPENVGPVVGQHRVEIESPISGQVAMDDEQALERLKKAGRKGRIEVVKIPAIYNTKSQLTAEISATAVNDLTFDLVSKSRR